MLSLRVHVPKQSLKRHHYVVVMARCNLRCTVSATATANVRPGKRGHLVTLYKAKHVLKAQRTYRIRVQIPRAALKAMHKTLHRHRKVRVTFIVTATNGAQFSRAAKGHLTLRR